MIEKILSHQISKNAFSNVFRIGIQLILAVVGNYLIVRAISPQEYGLVILALTVTSLLNLTDIGISAALIRAVAFDSKKTNHYFWHVWVSYLILGGLGVPLLLFIYYLIPSWLFTQKTPTFSLFTGLLIGSLFALLVTPLTNCLIGMQRMVASNSIEIIKSATFYLLVLYLLPTLGHYAFVTGHIGSNLLGLLAGFLLLKNTLRFRSIIFSKATIIELFQYGVKSYGIQLVTNLKYTFLKLLSSWLFPLEQVTFLELASRVMTYQRQLISALASPLMPAASAWQAKNKWQHIRFVLKHSVGVIAGIALISFIGVYFLAPKIIPIWLGDAYQPVVTIVQWGSLAVAFNALTAPGFSIFQGLNRFRPLLITAFLGLFAYIAFPSLVLVTKSPLTIIQGHAAAEALVSFLFIIWILRQ